MKEIRSCWGLFIVRNDSIFIENIQNHGDLHAFAYITAGIIENDTTIHFKNFMRSDGTEFVDYDLVYHFKQFSPKPDSTNNFF